MRGGTRRDGRAKLFPAARSVGGSQTRPGWVSRRNCIPCRQGKGPPEEMRGVGGSGLFSVPGPGLGPRGCESNSRAPQPLQPAPELVLGLS